MSTCHRCERTLVDRGPWLAKPVAERKRLARTHAIAEWQSGLCGACYRAEWREREIAYQGGWRLDSRGILRPTEGRAS